MKREWKSSSKQMMGSIWYFMFLSELFILCFLIPATEASQNDVSALMAFKKSSVDSDPNGYLKDWSSTSSTPCSWQGVSCSNDGKVTELNLTGAGLIGRLHLSDLMVFSSLTQLHLSNNFFSGDLSSTSPSSSSCSVEFIDLSANNFSEQLSAQSLLLSCDRRGLCDGKVPRGLVDGDGWFATSVGDGQQWCGGGRGLVLREKYEIEKRGDTEKRDDPLREVSKRENLWEGQFCPFNKNKIELLWH